MVALAGLVQAHTLARAGGQVVMAGDPWQLGPVVCSSLAAKHGLATSLLERLMALPLYSRRATGYDGRCITKLVRNFRSHPALLKLPARLFYSEELVACADPAVVNSLLHFPGLTERGRGHRPLLLHGVMGRDMREGRSPSYFNPQEVVVVLNYLEQLVAEGVKPADIGVISPYRAQALKVRDQLVGTGLEEVMVGTTEEFQGQERLAVILSTVRSSPEYLLKDGEARIGFLASSKRFNVAITRAKALLVVVGNPCILSQVLVCSDLMLFFLQDRDWSELVQYAVSTGCYTGCSFPGAATPGAE
jgi:helicase MOV-10